MGLLRFLLAAAVILFHSGGILGYAATGGGPSVQGFYIVSGFFMTMILNEKYDTPAKNYLFVTNRLIRIYSCYWFFLLLAFGYFLVLSEGPLVLLMAEFSRLKTSAITYLIASNIFIFGLDTGLFMGLHDGALRFEQFTESPAPQVHDFFLLPQAWSLGVELLFYLCAPFLLRRHWLVILAVTVAGFAARALSGLDGDPWTNRFFPFELAIFLLGALAYQRFARIKHRALAGWEKLLGLLPLVLVVLYPLYGSEALFFRPERFVLLGGLTAGLPYLFHMTRSIKADRMIGELSYPLYLCHGLMIWTMGTVPGLTGSWFCLAVLLSSILLAAAAVKLIEIPVDHLRQVRWQRLSAAG